MNDPTAANIARMVPALQPFVIEFTNIARGAGLPVIVTSTLRTPAEQQQLLRAGRTQTLNSLHVQGRAFDVDLYGWNRDAVPAWVWDWLGPLGEAIGWRWGGRWKSFRDVGHFEY